MLSDRNRFVGGWEVRRGRKTVASSPPRLRRLPPLRGDRCYWALPSEVATRAIVLHRERSYDCHPCPLQSQEYVAIPALRSAWIPPTAIPLQSSARQRRTRYSESSGNCLSISSAVFHLSKIVMSCILRVSTVSPFMLRTRTMSA